MLVMGFVQSYFKYYDINKTRTQATPFIFLHRPNVTADNT